MVQPDTTDGVTYLIETRNGAEANVISTLQKYYGGLLTEIVRNPDGCNGILLVTTGYELPPDALRRYFEVNDVVQTDVAIQDRNPESIADGCKDAVTDLPDGTKVSLAVNSSVMELDDSEVRQRCEDVLHAAELVVDGNSSDGIGIRVDVFGDWVGVSVKR